MTRPLPVDYIHDYLHICFKQVIGYMVVNINRYIFTFYFHEHVKESTIFIFKLMKFQICVLSKIQ